MLRSLFAAFMVVLPVAACEDSPPLVDDVREDAADRDVEREASDGASEAD